jgi:hypothetical protein
MIHPYLIYSKEMNHIILMEAKRPGKKLGT